MRIAINTRFLLKDKLEGIGWFTHEIVRRMVINHPEDDFFFIFDRPYDESFIFADNVEPIVVRPAARHPILWYMWFEFGVRNALARINPDVFFSPDSFMTLDTFTPTVLVIHDLGFEHYPEHTPLLVRKYYRKFTPKFCNKAEHIISVSHFTKQDIQKQYNIPSGKISVAGNACREYFKPLSTAEIMEVRNDISDGKPYFFFVGAVHPRKNVHRMIQAFDWFKTATKSDYKFIIAGRFAWDVDEVNTAHQSATHREDILFIGYQDAEQLPKITGAAYALLYPSLFEGFGVPILEAMNCDIPMIAGNTSSMPEVVGDAGILVDPTDVDGIARSMMALLQQPGLYDELVRRGRIQKEKFDWDRYAEEIYDILKGFEQ